LKAVRLHIFYTIVSIIFFTNVKAQTIDTLPAVKISAQKELDETKTNVPAQQLNKTELSKLNSLSVADAVKYFSGVLVKDYGGIGGLKTISVRSLGANHTGVMYDGIMLSEVQGGQVDLGKLSLDNIESITLYDAAPENILLPARSFAFASVLALKTTTANFDPSKKAALHISLKGGSFGVINPSLFFQYHFNKHFYNTLSTEYQGANGEYPFKAYEAGAGTAKRINSDIKSYRAEYNAGCKINDSNVIKLKTYYYNSDRGLPGSVVLYNPTSHQRLKDENFFIQASWQKSFTASKLLFNAKYNYAYTYYLDPDYPNTQGKYESKFHKKEYYFSGAYLYNFSKIFSASYSSDYFISTLTRSDDFAPGFAIPTRKTWLNNIAAKANFSSVEFQGDLLFTHQEDKVKLGNSGKNIDVLSPTITASYQPSNSSPLRIRAFYKNIFRAPTFDDLYYTHFGNTALRPEYAKQYNVGITYQKNFINFLQRAFATTDIYYNKVKDKIVAIPRGGQWTIENVSLVEIKGIDIGLQIFLKEINNINISGRLSYTFQQALDRSDKNSDLYNTQLPYVPKNSGAFSFSATYKKTSLSYSVLLSSYRYRIGIPIPDNLVKEWATNDISFSYSFAPGPKCNYKALLELNNIFNKQYEVIKYYPMPRFNYRVGIIADF
jgi:vitamin B12 transporter